MKDSVKNARSQEMLNEINTLWTEKYRPKELADLVLTADVHNFIKKVIDTGDIMHVIFHGKTGNGKNSIVNVIKNNIDAQFMTINASQERGIDIIRDKVENFATSAAWGDKLKIIVMNEADEITYVAQDSLRELMETASKNCRFIFTCNKINKISDPIRGRCIEFELLPKPRDIVKRLVKIYTLENALFDDDFIPMMLKKYGCNIRKIINESQQIFLSNNGNLSSSMIWSSSKYDKFFDAVFEAKTPKKITEVSKKMIFDEDIYGALAEYAIEKFNDANAIIIISDYNYKSYSMANKDLCFMSCILTLIDALNLN